LAHSVKPKDNKAVEIFSNALKKFRIRIGPRCFGAIEFEAKK